MSSIPYQPLDASRREIRVLDLLPGRYKTPIRCQLRTVSIADTKNLPCYAALSYTWGSAENKRLIIVSVDKVDYPVFITRNLFMALRGLRSRLRKETLWVDALGINQSDDEERASQVSFMGEVYTSATRTYVWLGSSIEPDSPVHEMHSLHRTLLCFVQAVPHVASDILACRKQWIFRYDGLEALPKILRKAVTAGRKCYTLDKALSLTIPAWQDRAWVLQEYVLSSNTYFCWDRTRLKKSLSIDGFEEVLRFMNHRRNIVRLTMFLNWLDGTRAHAEPREQSILWIGMWASISQASDLHDKVFALLGTIESGTARHILVDYTAPFWVTCARATYASTKYVRTDIHQDAHDWNRLKVFESIPFQRRRPPSFPSWVADFSARIIAAPISGRTNFCWPGSRDRFDADLSTDLRCLTIQGVRFGKVVTVLPMYKRIHFGLEDKTFELLEDLSPSDRVASYMELLASALRAHEASGACYHLEHDQVPRSDRLTELEHHLEQQRGGLVSMHEVHDVLEAFVFCWESQLMFHQASDYFCCYKSSRPTRYDGSLHTALRRASSVQLLASDDGFVGFVFSDIEVGDNIVFLRGAIWPALLWQIEGRWCFRSLVYLCGVMDGELKGAEDEPSWETEPFVLH
ncbi:hypothetical protein LTR15_012946 [Elasticomyces elasticus]|nr:hypothetical protein LTR15_012946 [Elasticomyces elasticus]